MAGALLLISFVLLATAIKIVPEYQRLVVFRLGRAIGAKGPGITFLIPRLDRAVLVDLREQTREIPHQVSMTRDNVPVSIDLVWHYRVSDPVESVLKTGNFEQSAAGLVVTTLRSVIGEMTFDEALAQREQINMSLRAQLNKAIEPWGVKLTNIEIREIIPPREIQEALVRQKASNIVVGSIGEAQTLVHSTGKVLVGSQTWDAISDRPIAPKSKVRIKRVILEVEDDTSSSSV